MVNSQQLAAEYVTGACSGVNTDLLRFYRFAGRLPVSRDKFPFHGTSYPASGGRLSSPYNKLLYDVTIVI